MLDTDDPQVQLSVLEVLREAEDAAKPALPRLRKLVTGSPKDNYQRTVQKHAKAIISGLAAR